MNNYPEVAEIIAIGFGYPEDVLSAKTRSDGSIRGQFFDSGRVFDYQIRGDGLEYQYNTIETNRITDYCLGRLDGLGIRADSDSAYSSLMQYYGEDVRRDNEPMDCRFGQCGDRCLKQGEKCRLRERLAGAAGHTKETAKLRSAQAKNAIKGARHGAELGGRAGYEFAKDDGKTELQARKEQVIGAIGGAEAGARVGRHVGTAKYAVGAIKKSLRNRKKKK